MSRVCACGCERSLDGRRVDTLYFDGTCRVRAFRALHRSTRPEPRGGDVVTLREATDALRRAA